MRENLKHEVDPSVGEAGKTGSQLWHRPSGPLLLCTATKQKNSGQNGREDMSQNGTEERYFLYREDTPGREGQVKRTTTRADGKIKARFRRDQELVAEEAKLYGI